MNTMIQRLSGAAVCFGVVGALCVTGCAPAEPGDGDEQVDEAQQAQIDPGLKGWREVTMTFADPASTALATVYVFNYPLGGYVTGTEYWYVNLDAVSLIGRYSLDVVTADQRNRVAPPTRGTRANKASASPSSPRAAGDPGGRRIPSATAGSTAAPIGSRSASPRRAMRRAWSGSPGIRSSPARRRRTTSRRTARSRSARRA